MEEKLKTRILSISKKLKLSHIGSNISCLSVLMEIYDKKKPEDLVILDNSHAHLAHLVVMLSQRLKKELPWDRVHEEVVRFTVELIEKFGIHCDRKAGCDASGGSLGHGLGIAIGGALADRNRMVYVILSEGSCMEGSVWEALRITNDLEVKNIEIHCNFNGYSAVAEIDTFTLGRRMQAFNMRNIFFHNTDNGEGFDGIQGHYKTI